MRKIILASQSPRRKELLEQIGIEFECMPAEGEESAKGQTPKEIVIELAGKKAEEINEKVMNQWILAADTVVAYGNQILGKPENEQHAKEMLLSLQGNVHEVYTGVCMINQETGEKVKFAECTRVYMNSMSEQEIEDYIATSEPLDKAGSYAIQGRCAAYIQKIEGDYYNVVGLPLACVYQVLKSW